MSIKIFAPSYLYNYELIAEEISYLQQNGYIILDESNKNDADHVLYYDFDKDLEIHRSLFSYRSPQLIYHNNRFVFNTAIRNFARRFKMANIYNLENKKTVLPLTTYYPLSVQDVANAVSDNKTYRLINSLQKFETAPVMNAEEIIANFDNNMIAQNIKNRGKMSIKKENESWLIETVNDLNVESKTVFGYKSEFDDGTKICGLWGNQYDLEEYVTLMAYINSLGGANEKHPFTMTYHYDGDNISITNFRFELSKDIPLLRLCFKPLV